MILMMNALSGTCRELIRNAFASMAEEEGKSWSRATGICWKRWSAAG